MLFHTYANKDVFAYKAGEPPECTNKMLSSFLNVPFLIKSISPATALPVYTGSVKYLLFLLTAALLPPFLALVTRNLVLHIHQSM